MEKIRSGQTFLYRQDGLNCTVIDIRLNQNVWGSVLRQALLKSLKRYPYLASKLVEKDGDFYIADNQKLSMTVRKTERQRALGSMANMYHLIEISYKGKHIFVSFHHALCDGIGIKPFVETLVYYYFCFKAHREFDAPAVRKVSDPIFPDETAEPLLKKYPEEPYQEPKVIKDGFALPEYQAQLEGQNIRFEIEIDEEAFMNAARQFHATPAIFLAMLVSSGIYQEQSNIDKPIVCSMAADMRKELGLPHTHKNCVRTMYLPFDQASAQMQPEELCGLYRAMLQEQRQPGYVKATANAFSALSDRLDELRTLEEKKKMLSFFDSMTINTYVVSYLGQFDWGECNSFIEAVHFYSGGIRGITVNMTAAGGKFNLTFIQNIETERYCRGFLRQLDQYHLSYHLHQKVQYSTTKDKTQKTAGRRGGTHKTA